MQSKLLIYCSSLTPRHYYIFNVLFNEVYKIDYSLTDNKEEYEASKVCKINYSNENICANELFVESQGLLSEKGLNEIEIDVKNINNEVAFFLSNNGEAYPFDLFAASFYLISRYEEYLPHLKDKHNRYKPEESIAFRNNFLEKPVVNIWIKHFVEELKNKYPELIIESPKFKFISTIDIDNAYLYKGKGFVRSLAFLFKAFVKFDFDKIKMAFSVTSKKRKDPFDTYSLQYNLQKKYNLDMRYFILLGDYGLNDKNISHTNSSLQTLVKRLADLSPVGIHPSYGSSKDEKQLAVEIKRLEDIQKREVFFSRQHFLKLSLPKTYKNLVAAGITDDYTMGYSSKLGFRAGIANPFTFYNLDTEQVMPIKVHPFAIVDDILKFNMDVNPEDVTESIANIIASVKEVDGTLVSIWHNDTFSNEGVWYGWRNVYEDMVKLIQK